jgi:hypothetical protein
VFTALSGELNTSVNRTHWIKSPPKAAVISLLSVDEDREVDISVDPITIGVYAVKIGEIFVAEEEAREFTSVSWVLVKVNPPLKTALDHADPTTTCRGRVREGADAPAEATVLGVGVKVNVFINSAVTVVVEPITGDLLQRERAVRILEPFDTLRVTTLPYPLEASRVSVGAYATICAGVRRKL